MKRILCIEFLLIWLIIGQIGFVYAQASYNVPATGNQSVNTCDAWIYDHAGANGNYNNSCNGYLVVYPASPNGKVAIIAGSYNTESFYDKVSVYNGVGTGGTRLAQWSGTGNVTNTIISTAANGALTIKFSSNNNTTKQGFALQVACVLTEDMSNTPLTGCRFNWLDPGGTGNYDNNQDVTQTICSESGEHVSVSFSQFALSSGDYLYVYDGNTISAPLMGSYTGTAIPPTINSSGTCLTFRFVSNGSGTSSGWKASISCRLCVPSNNTSGSPCAFDNIHPFCTDEGQYVYCSGITGTAYDFFGSNSVACLRATPAPAWYYMRIDQPGNMTIHIHQDDLEGEGIDVDFACWGPFNATSSEDFVEKLCSGTYVLHTASHGNNTSDYGYPYGNLVDCSYSYHEDEDCHIFNAQAGQYYLLLITNYEAYTHGTYGVITFNSTSGSTATTDCSIMAEVSNDGPYCVGDTIRLYCNNPQAGATYSWTGPNGWTSSVPNPVIYPFTSDMEGARFGLVKTLNGNSSDTAYTTIHLKSINTAITVSPSNTICAGQNVTLSTTCNVVSNQAVNGTCTNQWLPIGGQSNSVTIRPQQTTTYYLQQTMGNCQGLDSVTIFVNTSYAHIIASDTVICEGDEVTLTADCDGQQGPCDNLWLPGNQRVPTLQVYPTVTTSYILRQTTNGCVAEDTLLVRVNMPDVNPDTIFLRSARDSLPYVYQDQSFSDTGIYTIHYTNMYGCDSSVTFVLRYLDTIFVSLDTTVCPESFPYIWNGVTFFGDSVATVTTVAHNGADSIVQLTVQHYPNPMQSLNMMDEACAGDTLFVSIGLDISSNLVFMSNPAVQSGSQKIFLPDGISCAPYGTNYRSIANFSQFVPGSVMTNVNDILYVRLKMEHSALEDLKLSIVCPNGRRSKLIADYNELTQSWGNIHNDYFRTCLGLPNRLTDALTCDSTRNPMGEPWNYIWSSNTNHNYQYAAGTYGYCYESVNLQSYANPYWDFNSYWQFMYDSYTTHQSVKPSNPINMTQIYRPYQSFSNLIGCPLNGQWYIEIQDMDEEDNGYLTEWEVALAPSLLQTTLPSVLSKQLIGPWVTRLTDSTFIITPPANLMRDTTVSYRFVLQTDVGCQYDTTVSLTVYSQYNVARDTSVCDVDFPITWEGVAFNTAATQTLRLQTSHGCDSIVTLNVAVKATSSYTETVESCDAYTWQNGITYTASTNAPTVTLTNAVGCDSVVSLHLIINNTIRSVDEVFECDSFVWIDGNTYYESTNEPEHIIELETGCDSIVNLHLTLGHSAVSDTIAEACGSFTWYEHKNILNSCDNLTHVFNAKDGCDSTVTLHLTVFPIPLACFNFYTLGENNELGAILHFERCSPDVLDYHWDMGNAVTFEEPSFDYEYEHSGSYKVTLRVVDENGCTAEHHQVVVIKDPEMQIFIPNSFTPNQDGLNDVFKPTGLHVTDDHYLFVIYDRWGEVVFKTTNPEEGWDGTFRGSIVPDGSVMTYTFRCASDKGMVKRKGMVVVVY